MDTVQISVIRRCAALLTALFLMAAPSFGAPQMGVPELVDNVTVRVDSAWPGGLSRGWVPMQVEVRNDGSDVTSILVRTATRYTSSMSGNTQEFTVELKPGEIQTREVLVPVDRMRGSGSYAVYCRSGRRDAWISLPLGAGPSHELARAICVLSPNQFSPTEETAIVAALPMDDGSTLRGVFDTNNAPSSRVRWRSSSSEQAANVFTMTFDQLPRRTEGWSSVDTVVVDAREPLPTGARWKPMLEWVRSGGQLCLVGRNATSTANSFGGLALDLERPLLERDGVRAYRLGFGTLALADEERGSAGTAFALESPSEAVRLLGVLDEACGVDSVYPSALAAIYSGIRHQSGWGVAFPSKGLPLRPVVIFLFLFAMLVGPLNVLFARRKGRPSLLFLTVPVLSFVATVLVLVFGIFRQGFSTKGFAHSVAVIDQVAGRATTVESREMFIGRGGSSIKPAPGTTVLVPDDGLDRRERVVIDDGNQLELAGEFLPVRVRTRHMTVRDAPSRKRLEIKVAGERTIEVQNGLGVELLALEVRGPDDRHYLSEGAVGAGDKVLLRAQDESQGFANWLPESDELFEFVRAPRAGYAAVVAASPTADDVSITMDPIYERHAVVGTFDSDEAGWKR